MLTRFEPSSRMTRFDRVIRSAPHTAPRAPPRGARFWRPAPRAPRHPCQPCSWSRLAPPAPRLCASDASADPAAGPQIGSAARIGVELHPAASQGAGLLWPAAAGGRGPDGPGGAAFSLEPRPAGGHTAGRLSVWGAAEARRGAHPTTPCRVGG
jgi:hypothetical protein